MTFGGGIAFGVVLLWLTYGRALWGSHFGPPPF
jgi:hypothetical protein